VIPSLQGDASTQTPPDLPSFIFKERIVYLVRIILWFSRWHPWKEHFYREWRLSHPWRNLFLQSFYTYSMKTISNLFTFISTPLALQRLECSGWKFPSKMFNLFILGRAKIWLWHRGVRHLWYDKICYSSCPHSCSWHSVGWSSYASCFGREGGSVHMWYFGFL